MKTTYKNIYQLAAKNRGGVEHLEASLPRPKTAAQLAAQTDDRYSVDDDPLRFPRRFCVAGDR